MDTIFAKFLPGQKLGRLACPVYYTGKREPMGGKQRLEKEDGACR